MWRSELQLFRTGAFGASPLIVTRINGDTTAEQELVRSYAGGALQHPLAVTPARTAMVWHEGARLLFATLECPGL